MSTIRQTVERYTGTVPSEYNYLVNDVIEGLDERESMIVENLRSYGVGRGIPEDEVDRILEGAGLIEPDPEPEDAPSLTLDPGEQLADVARRIEGEYASLTDKVERLEQVVLDALNKARRAGIAV